MSGTKKISLGISLILAVMLAACSGLYTYSPANLLAAPVSAAAPVQSTPDVSTTPVTLAAYQATFEQIYNNVNPSVVNIEVVASVSSAIFPRNQFGFGGQNAQVQQTALGSGFVWDSQGHIVTNNHVVDGASKITVTFADGTVATAKLVGADPNADLAVIQVNVPESELHPVSLADSSQVKVGQIAVAIGNPYGLSGTMTVGIVSALGRTLPVGLDSSTFGSGPTYSIPDIIQTDASINPGNSGGVLVNDQGQLIGVTAAIQSSTGANAGIGFVIPSLIVQKVVPSLIKSGSYNHPWMGISGATLTPELIQANNLNENQQGVLVADVTPNSPAARAGLVGSSNQTTIDGQPYPVGGDVIVAVNGQTVKTFEEIVSYLFENTQPGQKITLTVLRNGLQKTIPLTLGVLPASGN
jgi:2-alkenal reductase